MINKIPKKNQIFFFWLWGNKDFDLLKQFRLNFWSDVEVSDEKHLGLKEEKIKVWMIFNAPCCKELVAFCKLKGSKEYFEKWSLTHTKILKKEVSKEIKSSPLQRIIAQKIPFFNQKYLTYLLFLYICIIYIKIKNSMS